MVGDASQNPESSGPRTRSAEQDDRSWNAMLLEGCSKSERGADTCQRDKIVSTAVANSRQRVDAACRA